MRRWLRRRKIRKALERRRAESICIDDYLRFVIEPTIGQDKAT
jgi:hypothetical protein